MAKERCWDAPAAAVGGGSGSQASHRGLALLFAPRCLLLGALCALSVASPDAPHVARCASLIPRFRAHPCSWFEGWYFRITDFDKGLSVAAVVGSMNGTAESFLALLHTLPSPPSPASPLAGHSALGAPSHRGVRFLKEAGAAGVHPRPTVGEEEGSEGPGAQSIESEYQGHLAGPEEEKGGGSGRCDVAHCAKCCGSPQRTQLLQSIIQGVEVTVGEGEGMHSVTEDPSDDAPPVFDWAAPGHGFVRKRGFNHTQLRLSLNGLTLEANLSRPVQWQEGNPGAGPEGWVGEAAKWLPPDLTLPCRWFIHSLGSAAEYRVTVAESSAPGAGGAPKVVAEGRGWAHEEKNWGSFFPAGHVWFQGMSANNSVQVVGAVAHFEVAPFVSSPHLIAVGIRTPRHAIDLRSTDALTTFLTPPRHDACAGRFKMCGRTVETRSGEAVSVCLSVSAPHGTFGDPLFAPTSTATWEPMCRESFSAVIKVEVWEGAWRALDYVRTDWTSHVPESAETFVLDHAALEFCGNYLCPWDI